MLILILKKVIFQDNYILQNFALNFLIFSHEIFSELQLEWQKFEKDI